LAVWRDAAPVRRAPLHKRLRRGWETGVVVRAACAAARCWLPAAAMSEIALRFNPQPANAALPKMHAQAACST